MNFQDNSQASARTAPGPKPSRKLYSIFSLLEGKAFKGSFETAAGKYKFEYLPNSASIHDGMLQLTGTMSVGARKQPGVKAVLAATQGGLTGAPSQITSRQPAGLSTEFTDGAGFVGALYFKLSPLSGSRLGVSCDMSSTQLNVRLYATSDFERSLQVAISDVVAVLGTPGEKLNNGVGQLNKLLAS